MHYDQPQHNMGERARIARYFAPLTTGEPGSFNLSDDAAILMPPLDTQLVITTDSVIEGIHLFMGSTPQQFAQKLVRRNLSDLAAMGATPWRYTINLHTPIGFSDDWFAQFSATLHAEQTMFAMTLVGGDSTSGAQAIHTTMTCFGTLDSAPLRRNGACVGDDIYVSATLGDAALALTLLRHNQSIDAALAARYHCPTPRLQLGKMLHTIATSCIDISDGLLADMQQICGASKVGATIAQDALPLSHHLKNAALDAATKTALALSGGDDYELCFTAATSQRATLQTLAKTLNVPLTRIGSITTGSAVQVLDANGNAQPISAAGWEHA